LIEAEPHAIAPVNIGHPPRRHYTLGPLDAKAKNSQHRRVQVSKIPRVSKILPVSKIPPASKMRSKKMANGQLIGFIGLGNMGGPMARNLAKSGIDLIVHDKAGTSDRAPEGAKIARSVAHVASEADPIILSLPDGNAVRGVISDIVNHAGSVSHTVVDTSTIGIDAARTAHRTLVDEGFEYIDAPVSGGVSGAEAATIAVMFAGSQAAFERLSPILDPMCKNLLHVGTKAGQGQAMKLLNNFLSSTAMAATSEAIAFGVDQGLDPSVMLEVLNNSSGVNSASLDKFPKRIVPGTFEAARNSGRFTGVAEVVQQIWTDCLEKGDGPDQDFTRIYPFVKGLAKQVQSEES
jgi:3-hydroxyisobutyrate dehydrogenase-like beta-hydroxyacid dehydrogenase